MSTQYPLLRRGYNCPLYPSPCVCQCDIANIFALDLATRYYWFFCHVYPLHRATFYTHKSFGPFWIFNFWPLPPIPPPSILQNLFWSYYYCIKILHSQQNIESNNDNQIMFELKDRQIEFYNNFHQKSVCQHFFLSIQLLLHSCKLHRGGLIGGVTRS